MTSKPTPATVNHWRIISAAIFFALVAVVFFLIVAGLNVSAQYRAFREREAVCVRKLDALKAEHQGKTQYLTRLINDPEFAERVARDRLNYSVEGETVIRFRD